MSIIKYVMSYVLCFVLVFSENASDTRDIVNNIEELRDQTCYSLAVSEAEEHFPHVEQYEGAGDGDYAVG